MKKTKLGITVGALGAITYFASFFSGYLVAIVLTGYVLLVEENAWLRRIVVKNMILLIGFSVSLAILNFIPDIFGIIGNIVSIFNGSVSFSKVNQIINVITASINIVQKVLFLGLGFKALNQGTIVIPFIDSLVSKYMS